MVNGQLSKDLVIVLGSRENLIKLCVMSESEHSLDLLGLLEKVKSDLDFLFPKLFFDVGQRPFE